MLKVEDNVDSPAIMLFADNIPFLKIISFNNNTVDEVLLLLLLPLLLLLLWTDAPVTEVESSLSTIDPSNNKEFPSIPADAEVEEEEEERERDNKVWLMTFTIDRDSDTLDIDNSEGNSLNDTKLLIQLDTVSAVGYLPLSTATIVFKLVNKSKRRD